MNTCVKDMTGGYAPAIEQSALSALLDALLGRGIGGQVIAALVGDEEKVSPQNLRDRLRIAIRGGALSRLTSKRLEKLQAALELGRQLYVEQTPIGTSLDSPDRAAAVFNCIAWEPTERFAIACLDIKHRLLSCRVISAGTATETLAHPREVFSAVLQAGATRCIVAHNHPSGDTDPSPDDISLTRQLLAAARVISLPILDHLVVSKGAYTSLRQTTALWSKED